MKTRKYPVTGLSGLTTLICSTGSSQATLTVGDHDISLPAELCLQFATQIMSERQLRTPDNLFHLPPWAAYRLARQLRNSFVPVHYLVTDKAGYRYVIFGETRTDGRGTLFNPEDQLTGDAIRRAWWQERLSSHPDAYAHSRINTGRSYRDELNCFRLARAQGQAITARMIVRGEADTPPF